MVKFSLLGCFLITLYSSPVVAQEENEKLTLALADYTVTENTTSCIKTNRIYSTEVVDDYNIIFEMRGKKEYLNTLPHKCHGLGFEESFGYAVRSGTLCSMDTITVMNRGSVCGLGKFIELTQK